MPALTFNLKLLVICLCADRFFIQQVQKWRLPAELPRIHAFASKHSEGYGVHTALVQFSTVMAKKLTYV